MNAKILLVGTVPYNTRSTSRAFNSYFNGWDKECLAQIFSNAKTPCKGHCGRLYQITDQRMLKRWFDKNVQTGVAFEFDDLPTEWTDNQLEVDKKTAKLYKLGSHKSSFIYLARKLIWRKRYWRSEKLDQWLDEFKPDCVFLSFSDDFFIPEIALYVARKYNIPIISSIGDDYYFNYSFSFSPLYHVYKLNYRRLIRKVFAHKGSAIFISDKIRDKYNDVFGLKGETVYLTSDITRHAFCPIDPMNLKVAYCGNIRLGRNEALCDIASALGKINKNYVVDVYSNENSHQYIKPLLDNPNVIYHGAVPYEQVKQIMSESDILPVVEGFKKKDVDITRYSLSTKVADSLATGGNVFAYGSSECGAIEYMQNIGCGPVCTSADELEVELRKLIFDVALQEENYQKSIEITERHHNLRSSTDVFKKLVSGVVRDNHAEK